MPEKIFVVGIGDEGPAGLTEAAKQRIQAAELLIGLDVKIDSLPASADQRVGVRGDFESVIEKIEANSAKKTVVVASGDPLFYGTARFLCERLGKDRFEVIPHVSSMQLAFARVKESWDEAYLTNLANQSIERVVERIRTAEKVGLFTSESVSPATVAQTLLDERIDYFTAYVCENLGSPDERVTQAELADVAGQVFAPLNVMILIRKPDVPDRPISMRGRRLFGNRDEAYLQSQPKRGLLTPSEVRSMALAELDLGDSSIVWDVGAGSGSIAIEAAQIAAQGKVFAIERDPEDYLLIAQNAERFEVTNLKAILGQAPEAWDNLPDPDAVFVGGTGRDVCSLVESAYERLRVGGRLVINVGSIENVAAVHHVLMEKSGDPDIWMVNLARGTYQLERIRFESINPTFLLAAVIN